MYRHTSAIFVLLGLLILLFVVRTVVLKKDEPQKRILTICDIEFAVFVFFVFQSFVLFCSVFFVFFFFWNWQIDKTTEIIRPSEGIVMYEACNACMYTWHRYDRCRIFPVLYTHEMHISDIPWSIYIQIDHLQYILTCRHETLRMICTVQILPEKHVLLRGTTVNRTM